MNLEPGTVPGSHHAIGETIQSSRVNKLNTQRGSKAKGFSIHFITWLRSARGASPPPPADQVDDFPQVVRCVPLLALSSCLTHDAARTYTGGGELPLCAAAPGAGQPACGAPSQGKLAPRAPRVACSRHAPVGVMSLHGCGWCGAARRALQQKPKNLCPRLGRTARPLPSYHSMHIQ